MRTSYESAHRLTSPSLILRRINWWACEASHQSINRPYFSGKIVKRYKSIGKQRPGDNLNVTLPKKSNTKGSRHALPSMPLGGSIPWHITQRGNNRMACFLRMRISGFIYSIWPSYPTHSACPPCVCDDDQARSPVDNPGKKRTRRLTDEALRPALWAIRESQ